jgi:hypothetical protein
MMVIAKFKKTAGRYGRRQAWEQAAHKALARLGIVKFLHVLWLVREDLPVASPAQDSGIEVRPLFGEELALYTRDAGLELPQSFVDDALAGGSVCLGAFMDGTFAAYTWFGRQGMELYPGLQVAVCGDAAYAYKGLTLPDYRERHCLSEILRRALEMPVLPGVRRLVSLVEAANLPSLTACARIGFKCSGKLCMLGPAPQRRWFYFGGGKRTDFPRIMTSDSKETRDTGR